MKVWVRGVALAVLTLAGSAEAAIFGVPTPLSTDGRTCVSAGNPAGCPSGPSIDPPGYFVLTGTAAAASQGDAVHQLRLFVEVTGPVGASTLDIRVFDAGDSGARDTASASNTHYQLLDPCTPFPTCTGAVRRSVVLTAELAGVTEDRLARFSANPADVAVFTTANTGSRFTGLNPGLYEFRVTMENAGTAINAFGVEVTDGAATPAHYNVFTVGFTDPTLDTAFLGGSRDAGVGTDPDASITQPMTFFPYVDHGCSIQTSNFDGDGTASAGLRDALGNPSALTVSANNARADDTITIQSTTSTNYDSTNYGMYRLTNDTGPNNNVDWRVADYRGWADLNSPRNPTRPLRMYLPNAYSPVTGNANAVAPSEPILQSGFRVASGANPPAVGSPTTYLVTGSLYNSGPGPISNVVLQIPLGAGGTLVPGSPSATIDGLPATCAEAGGLPGFLTGSTTAMQCTFTAPVPLGSIASLTLQVTYTPVVIATLPVTGPPSIAVTSLTRGGGTATATTQYPHWFRTGDQVVIANANPVAYNNGGAPVTITGTPAANQFTYALAGASANTSTTVTATEANTQNSVIALYTPAYASAAFPRTESAGPVCQAVYVPLPSVNLSVTKTDAPDPVVAGQNVTYTITVSNSGPAAAPNASLNDSLPAATTFQSIAISGAGAAGWTCTTPPVGSNGTVSCTKSSLATGAAGTTIFTLVAQVAPATTAAITNTASVTSGGQDTDLTNNSASATTAVNRRADLGVTKTDSPDPVQAGQDITYTITVTNNGPSNSSAVTLAEAVPANTTFRAIALPSGWSCPTLPAVGGTGAISCQGPAGLAAAAAVRINLLVRVNAGVATGTTITNTATVSVTAGQDTVAGNNTATATTLVGGASTAPTCATGRSGAGGTLSGIINTYYPGTASVAAAATSITLGAATGTTPIAAGDLVLVIQMQDAAIDSNNDERYGDGTGTAGNTIGNGSGATSQNNVGLYEYVIATSNVPLGGGALALGSGLVNAYTNAAATAAQGQRRFQVVRVPQYATATLGAALTAAPWDGTAGGILAFDVTGNLALGTATVNVTGRGFRGGLGRQLAGGTGTGADYRNPAAQNVHGSKGEGTAGTPRYVWSAIVGGAGVDTGVDGYPNGSSARGAPGNAGGGGTDSNPAANDENSGGGGGGNGGTGGLGGNTWRTNLPRGGFGGAVFPATANRLVLGGGGGAGTRNNSAGVESSGGAGGALVMIRTNTSSGTGTITTDGDPGVEPDNDGGGGGGAGGTVLFLARGQAGLAGLTINARGGRGSDAWPGQAPNGTPGERHGPGGGGAGGRVFASGAATAVVVTGGANGVTTTALDAFGATPGTGGQSAITLTDGSIPAFCPVTDVGVSKTATPEPVLAGQNLTYTITVTSLLTSANVTVTDTLPATLAFVSATTSRGICSFASPTLTCVIGTLTTGEVVIIDVVATALASAIPPGTITNTANVSTTSTDIVPANDADTVVSTVIPAADLAVTKTGSPDPVQAGQDLTYTITVTNNGPSPAQNPSLGDPLPPGTTFQSLASPAGWTCSTPSPGANGTVSCTAASLASGASAAFTLVVRVGTGTAPGASIANTATVSATTADPVAANNSATEVTTTTAPVTLLTRATIRGIRVDRAGRVEFATGTQRGTLSFNLYATDDPGGNGERVLLNPEPVRAPVPDSPVPILYEVRTAPIAARYLMIEETDRRGRPHVMGPFVVGDPRLAAAYERVEKRLRATGVQEVRARGAERARRLVPREDVRAIGRARIPQVHRQGVRERLLEGLKVEVSQPGQVLLTRAALEASGLPPSVPLQRLSVSTQGVLVAATLLDPGTQAEALRFQAEGLSTTYTGRSVYLLTWADGPTLDVTLSRDEDPADSGWTRVSRNLIYDAAAPRGTSPWLWDVAFSDGPGWPESSWDPEAGTFDLPGIRSGSAVTAAVRLRVAGGSDHKHVVEAWINEQSIGSVRFEGRSAAVLDGLAAGLQASGNRLSLTYHTEDGSPDGLLLIDHLDLAVPPASATGPAIVETVSPFNRTLPRLSGVNYLIVTHAAFAEQAQRLAELKRAEGLSVAVVDVERAYDRFSAGIVEAGAVRALVQQAFRGGRLRYVLLMGDDTYDPQGFSGLGEVSFVPSLYGWDGDFGRVPSENRYADVDDDGSPDVAIGRLPVRSAAEADAIVTKIAGQTEVLRAAKGRHLFVTDNQAPGETSFAAEAQASAARLPAASQIAWVDLDQGALAARAALAAGMERSPSVVHYFGHGGPEVWADEHLLAVEDVPALAGSGSVFLTWACQVQDYQYIFGRSVNEALLMKPEGGAIATFGPAGIADAAAQAAFYERLYAVLAARRMSLGEAIRRAKAQALAADPRVVPVVESWNLLGDPAVVVEGLVAAPVIGR